MNNDILTAYDESKNVTSIKELMDYSIRKKCFPTLLLVEFLWREKGTIQLTDSVDVLDRYFSPRNREKMNHLLREFEHSGKCVLANTIR